MPIFSLLQRWTSLSLLLRIAIGLVIGVALGLLCPELPVIGLLGKLFVTALKSIAPVLVMMLIIASISRATTNIGSRTRKVVFRYILTTLLAAVVSVGLSFAFPVEMVFIAGGELAAPENLGDVFTNLLVKVADNPVSALVEANYLAILMWSAVIGLAMRKVASKTTIDLIGDLSEVVMKVVKWVIECAPFGILGLSFSAVSESGLNIFVSYGSLLLIIVGSMFVSAFVINPLLAYYYLRTNPYPLLWFCLKNSGLNAFFTRSSAANLPINMSLCERLKIDKNFYSVSIPLGCTINMDGAAVTISVMTLAVCHTLGVEVGMGEALILCMASALGACGASGVPGGSLLLIPMACSLFGIGSDVAMQAVAVGFIIAVVQDSFETCFNSSSDVYFTAVSEFHDCHLSPEEVRQRIREAK